MSCKRKHEHCITFELLLPSPLNPHLSVSLYHWLPTSTVPSQTFSLAFSQADLSTSIRKGKQQTGQDRTGYHGYSRSRLSKTKKKKNKGQKKTSAINNKTKNSAMTMSSECFSHGFRRVSFSLEKERHELAINHDGPRSQEKQRYIVSEWGICIGF